MLGKYAVPAPHQATAIRLLAVLFFIALFMLASSVVAVVIMVQFGWRFAARTTNDRLLLLSAGLTRYMFDILQFITFNHDQKPYPFSAWPTPAEPSAREY